MQRRWVVHLASVYFVSSRVQLRPPETVAFCVKAGGLGTDRGGQFPRVWCICEHHIRLPTMMHQPSYLLYRAVRARAGGVLARLTVLTDYDRLRVGWLNGPFWKGYHESRRCSRHTYPESYITKYTSIRRLSSGMLDWRYTAGNFVVEKSPC